MVPRVRVQSRMRRTKRRFQRAAAAQSRHLCGKAFLLEDLGLDIEYLQTTSKGGADTAGQQRMGRLTRGGRAKYHPPAGCQVGDLFPGG